MIPASDTIAIAEFELEGACAWGGRHQVPIHWTDESLVLRATFTQPETGELFFLRGGFDNYKELPPAMTFCTKDWESSNAKANFPKPPPNTPFGSSLFINHGGVPVICAPFNRLAYKQFQGPHGDWGDAVHWQEAALDRAHATTIGDMLQVVFREINLSRGRMG